MPRLLRDQADREDDNTLEPVTAVGIGHAVADGSYVKKATETVAHVPIARTYGGIATGGSDCRAEDPLRLVQEHVHTAGVALGPGVVAGASWAIVLA